MFTSSFESFVFTRTAAGHILGGVCQRLEVWSNCVWAIVVVNGKKLCRFISKKRFLAFFAESRKQRSHAITVTQNVFNPRLFTARSASDENKTYSLTVHDRFLSCSCEDFSNQCKLIPEGKPKACKHVYAVLKFMGYQSLSAYVNRKWDINFRF